MTDPNPLVSWALLRFRRDRKTLFGLIVFLFLFYGLIGLSLLIWLAEPPWSRQLEDLFTAFYFEAWSVNGMLLLLLAPARLAQTLAQEKSRGTLDMLRLTGLAGWELALGKVVEAMLLPASLAALTAPVVLLGVGGHGGLEGTLRGYLGLLPLSLSYTLLAGLIGLGVKKAQHGPSTAIFLLLVLLGFSAGFNFSGVPEMRGLGLLGPWGPGFTTFEDDVMFSMTIFGVADAPGELLLIPVHALFIASFSHGLARRLAGDPVALIGRWGALGVALAIGFAAALTFFPAVDPGFWRRNLTTRASFTCNLTVAFLGMLLLAAEIPVRWRDLVRGLARRGKRDRPFPEERLNPLRFLPGVAIPLGMGLLLGWPLLYGYTALWEGRTPEVSVAGTIVALSIMAAAWTLAALAFQVVQLWVRDKGAPRLLTAMALATLWFAPFLASYGMRSVGFPSSLYELPRVISPFFGIYAAGYATSTTATASGASPLALATAAAVLNLGGVGGLLYVLGMVRQRAEEHAETLVALPADAYGAPGTLTNRCPNEHLFAQPWTRCPHCREDADAQDDDLSQPALQQEPPNPQPLAGEGGAAAGGDRVSANATVPRGAGDDLPGPGALTPGADEDGGGEVRGAQPE